EDGIRDFHVTGVQTCALPISGLETIQEMRDKVVELSSERPEFKILLKRLGIPMSGPVTTTGMNEQTVKLQTQFKQQFDKANYTRSEERRVGKECRYRR